MFKYFEPNPRGRNMLRYDCFVRALCVILGCDWVEAFNFLVGAAREVCTMPQDLICAKHAMKKLGYTYHSLRGQRITVADFALSHPTGIYLLRPSAHYVALKDGIYYDNGNCGNNILNSFFEKRI